MNPVKFFIKKTLDKKAANRYKSRMTKAKTPETERSNRLPKATVVETVTKGPDGKEAKTYHLTASDSKKQPSPKEITKIVNGEVVTGSKAAFAVSESKWRSPFDDLVLVDEKGFLEAAQKTTGNQEFERMYKRIKSIFGFRRLASSSGELQMIRNFIKPYDHEVDGIGNIIVKVGKSDILWSCHTDTVHRMGADKNAHQKVSLYRNTRTDKFYFALDKKSRKAGNCLGADDGAGLFIMLEMIDAGIPGTYIFHRGEEQGCVGSNWIHKHRREWLSQFKYAIAFDRADCNEIITHQAYGRTASDKFAESMAHALNDLNPTFKYAPSDRGVYTDTNSYAGTIPECTNIGVGYRNQHGPTETQDLMHLIKLRNAMIQFSESCLVCDRDPKKDEDNWDDYLYYRYGNSKGDRYGRYIENDYGQEKGSRWSYGKKKSNWDKYGSDDEESWYRKNEGHGFVDKYEKEYDDEIEETEEYEDDETETYDSKNYDKLVRLCQKYPMIAAEIMYRESLTAEDFCEVLMEVDGKIDEIIFE